MSKLLLNLYRVPHDEADEVRDLLDRHQIEFYETRPSRWGISHGGIWIKDPAAATEAKRLMAEYQGQRQHRARSEYAAARRDGSAPTLWSLMRDQPLHMLLVLLGVLFMLGLVALPLLLLRQ